MDFEAWPLLLRHGMPFLETVRKSGKSESEDTLVVHASAAQLHVAAAESGKR